jgi:hypothetical protein
VDLRENGFLAKKHRIYRAATVYLEAFFSGDTQFRQVNGYPAVKSHHVPAKKLTGGVA